MLGSVPLQFLVPLITHNRRAAPGQASLGDIHVVALHPLRPVSTVTAVDESGTFEEERGPSHHRSFLEEPEHKKK